MLRDTEEISSCELWGSRCICGSRHVRYLANIWWSNEESLDIASCNSWFEVVSSCIVSRFNIKDEAECAGVCALCCIYQFLSIGLGPEIFLMFSDCVEMSVGLWAVGHWITPVWSGLLVHDLVTLSSLVLGVVSHGQINHLCQVIVGRVASNNIIKIILSCEFGQISSSETSWG